MIASLALGQMLVDSFDSAVYAHWLRSNLAAGGIRTLRMHTYLVSCEGSINANGRRQERRLIATMLIGATSIG